MSNYELGMHRGKYVAVYYDEHGNRKRRSLGTSDESVAKRLLLDFEKSVEDFAITQGLTVTDVFKRYLADRKLEVKGNKTVENMTCVLNNLQPMFGHLYPIHISKQNISDYILERSKTVQPGTIWSELTYLRSAMNWAFRNKLLTQPVYVPVPPKPSAKERHLSREEIEHVLSCEMFPHLRLFIILAIATAARSNALFELTWDRVDFDKRIVNLINPDKPTTHKGRAIVPINNTLYEALIYARQIATCDYVIEFQSRGIKDAQRGFQNLSERSGIYITPHMLRHSAAVWMAEAGVPMSEISQYLGHRNSKITESIYARYSPNYLRTAASALELPASARKLASEDGGVTKENNGDTSASDDD